jgi:hypothetical protein
VCVCLVCSTYVKFVYSLSRIQLPLTCDILVDLGMESIKKVRSYLKWSDKMDKAMSDVFVEH